MSLLLVITEKITIFAKYFIPFAIGKDSAKYYASQDSNILNSTTDRHRIVLFLVDKHRFGTIIRIYAT